MEIFRFYFGSFERLTRRLLLCLAFPEMEALLPWIPDGTRSDGETFVVTPATGFADHATCLQIAILLSNPDLMEVLNSIINSIRAHVLTGAIASPIIEFLVNAKSLRVLIGQTHVRQIPGGPYGKAKIAQQILSDNRDMPFSLLIIRDPRSNPYGVRNKLQGATRLLNLLETDEEMSNPSIGTDSTDSLAPSVEYLAPFDFSEAFPGMERAKVKYVKPTTVSPKRPKWMQKFK